MHHRKCRIFLSFFYSDSKFVTVLVAYSIFKEILVIIKAEQNLFNIFGQNRNFSKHSVIFDRVGINDAQKKVLM